jgi:hypothetical protein
MGLLEGQIIDEDYYPLVIKEGEKYHCSWAPRGCVWVFSGLTGSNGEVELFTPKTRKRLVTNRNTLRNTNANARKQATQRINHKKLKNGRTN